MPDRTYAMFEHDRQNDNDGGADARARCRKPDLTADASLLLPFIGRESDLARLLSFIRNAATHPSLSLLWVEGEGGIGKSRLLKEAQQQIDPKTLIIYIRFRQDATFSLPQSLAVALQESAPSDSSHLSDSLSSILASLREHGRRYPTLLVLEDLHLLDTKGVADLVVILHGMEHERLGVLCVVRPGNETVFGAVLPFLTETIRLKPLSIQAIRQLGKEWGYDLRRLPNLTRFLHQSTRGIPLVVQSVVNNFLARRPEFEKNPLATIHHIADETKRSLTHGLTVGLSEQDIEAARRLATLGETFSMGGAAIVLNAPQAQVERLRQAGVLVQSFGEEAPLYGTASDHDRYSFSHSLLHERLLSEAPPPDDRVSDLLESDVPLYATTFFTYLARTIDSDFAPDRIARMLDRLVSGAEALIDSPNWKAASIIHSCAQTIFRHYRKELSEADARLIRFHLLRLQLHILNAFPSHPDFTAAADELLAMTENPGNAEQAIQRITALEYSIFRTDAGWNFRANTAFDETEDLVERFPEILLHPTYVALLGNITGALRISASPDEMARARRRFNTLMAAAKEVGNKEIQRTALLDIAPSFLALFNAEEELEERKQLAEMIAAECGEERPQGRFAIAWPRFLESIGEMYRARTVLDQWAPHPLTGYNVSLEFALRLLELIVDSALDVPLAEIERAGFAILEEFQNIQKMEEGNTGDITLAQASVATHSMIIALMRNEIEWGNRLSLALCGENAAISHYLAFERAALARDVPSLERLLNEGQIPPSLLPLVRYSVGREQGSREEAAKAARDVLETPVIQRSNILSVRLVLALLSLTLEDPERDLRKELEESIYQGTQASTKWLATRKLPAYLRPLLNDMGPFIGKKRQAASETIDEAVRRNRQQPDTAGVTAAGPSQKQAQIRISMIGAITYTAPNQKPAKVRGPRPQQLLGLLTANELLDSPISLADFRFLVTGSGSQEESANYLRVLVSRMRKQLGHDAILSDGEGAPRLNPALVQVDLIEATGHIRQALSMARNRRADQAGERLMQGMELLAAGEPYPRLSDKIFAAAREELRVLLRQALIETAALLRQGQEGEWATALLRKGLELLNDDEELTKMIGET